MLAVSVPASSTSRPGRCGPRSSRRDWTCCFAGAAIGAATPPVAAARRSDAAQVEHKDGGPRGSGIYSRFPLSEEQPLPVTFAAQPTALLELPERAGGRADLVAAGAEDVTQRLRLLALRAGSTTAPGSGPRWWRGASTPPRSCRVPRRTCISGYVDAAIQTGESLTRTWEQPRRSPGSPSTTCGQVRAAPCSACSVHAIPGSNRARRLREIQASRPRSVRSNHDPDGHVVLQTAGTAGAGGGTRRSSTLSRPRADQVPAGSWGVHLDVRRRRPVRRHSPAGRPRPVHRGLLRQTRCGPRQPRPRR